MLSLPLISPCRKQWRKLGGNLKGNGGMRDGGLVIGLEAQKVQLSSLI